MWHALRTEIGLECYEHTYRPAEVQASLERFVAEDKAKERGYDRDRYPRRKAYLLEYQRRLRARMRAAGIKRAR